MARSQSSTPLSTQKALFLGPINFFLFHVRPEMTGVYETGLKKKLAPSICTDNTVLRLLEGRRISCGSD
jgi:hypothetical protein